MQHYTINQKQFFNPTYTVREFDNDEWIVFPWEN